MFALLFCVTAGAQPADRLSDEFLYGYVTAVLEKNLGWESQSYGLAVEQGTVTLMLPAHDVERGELALEILKTLDALEEARIEVVFANGSMTAPPVLHRSRLLSMLHLSEEGRRFPRGNLFEPLVADQKQPRFFISLRRFDTEVEQIFSAAVGYGENFGIYRFKGMAAGDGLQFNVDGGLFAQFNLDAASDDLVNADYTLGLPVTYRLGPWSARVRLYHQSSHLGDEFLLRTRPERVNLSYESLEALGSYDRRNWRYYFGGEYLIHRDPGDLDRAMLHGGVEYYGSRRLLNLGYLIAGLDLKSFDEHDWSVDAGVNAGLHFGELGSGKRFLRVMAEGYKGFSPYGQFYNDRVSYVGLYLSLGL